MSVLSERLRPDVECAPWVIEEVRKLEAVLAKLREQEPVAWMQPRMPEKMRGPATRTAEAYGFVNGWNACVDTIKANAAPMPAVVQVPPGYKLVPVEPEMEMLRAASGAWEVLSHDTSLTSEARFRKLYLAFIADAPEAPATAVVQVPQCHKRANDYCKCSRNAMLCDGVGPSAAPEAPATAVVQVPQGFVQVGTYVPDYGRGRVEWADNFKWSNGNPPLPEGHPIYAAPEAPAQGEQSAESVRDQERAAFESWWHNDGLGPMDFQWDAWLACARAKPIQPPVPAPWREAVKVAREALAQAKHNTTHGQIAANCRDAIAQLDALEGGE